MSLSNATRNCTVPALRNGDSVDAPPGEQAASDDAPEPAAATEATGEATDEPGSRS